MSRSLPQFVEVVCPGRTAAGPCYTCRSSRAWRDMQAYHYQMPAGGIEECPFEVTAESVGARVTAYPAPSRPASMPPIARLKLFEVWGLLHRWPFSAEYARGLSWFDDLRRHLPCGPCEKHLLQVLATAPPPLADPVAAFAWTVKHHNTVNVMRGKPAWTVSQAAARWLEGDDRPAVKAGSIDN